MFRVQRCKADLRLLVDGRVARKDYQGMGRRSGGDGCVHNASRGDGFMGVRVTESLQTVNVYGLLNVTITPTRGLGCVDATEC